MARNEIDIKNGTISLYGTPKDNSSAIAAIQKLELTGIQSKDRLLIQEALKDEPCLKKQQILYNGNTVYAFEPIVREFKRIKKKGDLSSMSNGFYQLLAIHFDIAHYNKNGFVYFYNDSFDELWSRMLSKAVRNIPDWYTDLQRIADEFIRLMK